MMGVNPKTKTHVGPPVAGSGSYDFNSTTKVYAFVEGTLPIGVPGLLVFYTDIQLDTLGEFSGSIFQPVEDGWYGIGGHMVCGGINLNTHNGTYRLQIDKIGEGTLFESIWDAEPISLGSTSCEFYNFVYLLSTDAIVMIMRQSPTSPTAYLTQASLLINRVL